MAENHETNDQATAVAVDLNTRVSLLEKDNMILRELLWLRHGCSIINLYGDDGEMQCNKCGIDFKRDKPESIKQRFYDLNKPAIIEYLKRTGQAG
jgi:hypothetical protein